MKSIITKNWPFPVFVDRQNRIDITIVIILIIFLTQNIITIILIFLAYNNNIVKVGERSQFFCLIDFKIKLEFCWKTQDFFNRRNDTNLIMLEYTFLHCD